MTLLAFNLGVLVLLVLDLFVFNRKHRAISLRESLISTAGWVSLSLAFCGYVWGTQGQAKGLEFITGYLIEYALSVDNLFVFVLIFSYFKVDIRHQHRVLFWGVIGAIAMRAMMIAVGVQLVVRFEWLLYLFGLFLVVTGIKMAFETEHDVDVEKNLALRLCRRWFRFTDGYRGSRFWVRENGMFLLTPMALVLLLIEIMDLVFAVDSIPAVFAVTRDPFIVYTSNICAILGLRSTYFLLARVVDRFVYLKYGLAAVLTFIGGKMLVAGFWHVPVGLSLGVVAALLGISVAASLLAAKR